MNERTRDEYGGKQTVRHPPVPRTEPQFLAESSHDRHGENGPHRNHTPVREGRWRDEEKSIDDIRWTGDPEPAHMDHHGSNDRSADDVVKSTRSKCRYPWQIATNQKWLDQHERQSDNAGKSSNDVDRTAIGEKWAHRRRCDRNDDGHGKGGPDEDLDRSRLARLQWLKPVRGQSEPRGWWPSRSASPVEERPS